MRLNNQKCLTLLYTLPLCRLVQWSDLSIGYILLDIGSNVCCYTDGTGRPSQLHRTSHHVINAGYRLWNICHYYMIFMKYLSLHFLKITYTIAAETCYSRMFILWILSCTFSFMHAIHIISIDQIFFGFAFSIWLVIFSQWINFLYLSRMAAICSFCLRTFSHCAPNTAAVEVFADHARTPGK